MLLGTLSAVALIAHSVIVSGERERIASERDRAEDALYVAHTLLAQRDWEEGNLGRFQDLLGRYEPGEERAEHVDRRGWEWYYLRGLSRRGLLLELDGADIWWSPDGPRCRYDAHTRNARRGDDLGCDLRRAQAPPAAQPFRESGYLESGWGATRHGRVAL